MDVGAIQEAVGPLEDGRVVDEEETTAELLAELATIEFELQSALDRFLLRGQRLQWFTLGGVVVAFAFIAGAAIGFGGANRSLLAIAVGALAIVVVLGGVRFSQLRLEQRVRLHEFDRFREWASRLRRRDAEEAD
jgi:hypothetical protein